MQQGCTEVGNGYSIPLSCPLVESSVRSRRIFVEKKNILSKRKVRLREAVEEVIKRGALVQNAEAELAKYVTDHLGYDKTERNTDE